MTYLILSFLVLSCATLNCLALQLNDLSRIPVRLELSERLDDSLKQGEAGGFSGALLVEKGGRTILNKGYGLADRQRGVRIDKDTVFHIGSLAKQFTAAAILKLEMAGKLKVEDSIDKFLYNVPEDKRAITIHHLLTHSSGLIGEHSDDDYHPEARDEVVGRILQSKPDYQPGARYQYSNADYMLLAAIAEKVSRRSFEKFLHEAIFKPAGMSKTGFVTEQRERKNVACGYEGSYKGNPLDEPIPGGSWFRRGAGGIVSTASDLRRWHLALKNDAIRSDEAK